MIWRFGDFYLDSVRFRLIDRIGRDVAIQPKAFKALECLIRNAPNVVSRQQLLEEVWGHSELCVNTLSQTIHEIRRALSEDANRPVIVGTRHGEGYFLLVDAEQLAWRELSSVTAKRVLVRQRVIQLLIHLLCLAGGILIGMYLI